MKRRCTVVAEAGRKRERKTEGWNASDTGSYREAGNAQRTVGCRPPKVMICQVRKKIRSPLVLFFRNFFLLPFLFGERSCRIWWPVAFATIVLRLYAKTRMFLSFVRDSLGNYVVLRSNLSLFVKFRKIFMGWISIGSEISLYTKDFHFNFAFSSRDL